jgi:hypothetical protein
MKLTLFTILFVVSAWAAAVPAPELVSRGTYTVYPYNQCLLQEANPNTPSGLSFQGQIQEVSTQRIIEQRWLYLHPALQTTEITTTLVGFQMPSWTDYSAHTCQLIFQYPYAVTGSNQFTVRFQRLHTC